MTMSSTSFTHTQLVKFLYLFWKMNNDDDDHEFNLVHSYTASCFEQIHVQSVYLSVLEPWIYIYWCLIWIYSTLSGNFPRVHSSSVPRGHIRDVQPCDVVEPPVVHVLPRLTMGNQRSPHPATQRIHPNPHDLPRPELLLCQPSIATAQIQDSCRGWPLWQIPTWWYHMISRFISSRENTLAQEVGRGPPNSQFEGTPRIALESLD